MRGRVEFARAEPVAVIKPVAVVGQDGNGSIPADFMRAIPIYADSTRDESEGLDVLNEGFDVRAARFRNDTKKVRMAS